jgi:prepilin peptidase CpaA
MNILSDFSLTKAIFVIALLLAAIVDLARFRIPNVIIGVLLLVFAFVALTDVTAVSWSSHLIACAAFFFGGVLFYGFGQMGAGDVKLLGAIALWGGTGALLPLAFWISVAGLLLIVLLLPLRILMPLLRARLSKILPASLPKVLVRGEGVPYGVAICAGTFLAIPTFPVWLWNW